MDCPACEASKTESVMALEHAPASCQQLFRTREESIQAGAFQLNIVICSGCGLVWNAAYEEDRYSPYDDDYYCSFIASTEARDYQESLASKIDEIVGVKGKTVVELGCGDGFFLSSLATLGARAIGFEPSATYELARNQPGVHIINDFFRFDGTSSVDGKVELMVMRNILEHLAHPREVLESLATRLFDGHRLKYLFLEVPNVHQLLQENLYFDFYNDHIFYYSYPSLIQFLKSTGWQPVAAIGPKDEFVRLISVNSHGEDGHESPLKGLKVMETGADVVSEAAVFQRSLAQWRLKLKALIQEQRARGGRIAVWGAGSRGVMLLASLGDSENDFAYVVDSDVNKHGKYIPSIGLPVHPLDRLKEDPVNCIMVTSYTYFDEIMKSLKWFQDAGGKVIKVYPVPETIT